MLSHRLRWTFLCVGLVVLVMGESCNCESEGIATSVSFDVRLANPEAGPVAGDVPVAVSISYASSKAKVEDKDVRMIEVFLTPQEDAAKARQIAEMHKPPFTFNWSSIQAHDGFYLMRAVVYDMGGEAHESKRVLVQVVNTAPELWYVNCADGQFVRGSYSLVVSLHRPKAELLAPPTLSINGLQGPETTDRRHPYRYTIDTKKFKEGEQITLAVSAEDVRGNTRRIVCRPRIDNVLPTVRFIRPAKDGDLLGRSFQVAFDAFDQFGVREVRLFVDGSACAQSRNEPDPSCSKNPVWVGKQSPAYPIQVTLSDAYQTEQTILLTARAIDQAGNASDPPARLRIRIDPQPPEIFIRAPGQGEVIANDVQFTARITDNELLTKVSFRVEGGKAPVPVLTETPNKTELTLSFKETDAIKRFGYGRRYLVVSAEDRSGNKVEVRRLFNVGCSDSTDCAVGKVCHKFICKTPAGLNEPCDDDTPCALQSSCIQGQAPLCSQSKQTFCRQRCHPGNKVVSPDPCPTDFYCDKGSQTCLPTDACQPLDNACGRGKQCVPVDDDANFCMPEGSVGLDQACQEDCNPQGNCQRGLWCVFDLVQGRHSCLQACDTQKPGGCGTGTRCLALRWSFGGAPLRYGVCLR